MTIILDDILTSKMLPKRSIKAGNDLYKAICDEIDRATENITVVVCSPNDLGYLQQYLTFDRSPTDIGISKSDFDDARYVAQAGCTNQGRLKNKYPHKADPCLNEIGVVSYLSCPSQTAYLCWHEPNTAFGFVLIEP